MKYEMNNVTRMLLNSLANSKKGQYMLIDAYNEAKKLIMKIHGINADGPEDIERFLNEYSEDVAMAMAMNLEDILDFDNDSDDSLNSYRKKLVKRLGRQALDYGTEYYYLALEYLNLTREEIECSGDEYWPAGYGDQGSGSILELALNETESECTLAFAHAVTDPDFLTVSGNEFCEYLTAAVDSLVKSLQEHECSPDEFDDRFPYDVMMMPDTVIENAENYFTEWLCRRERKAEKTHKTKNCDSYPHRELFLKALNKVNFEYVSKAFFEKYWEYIRRDARKELQNESAEEK